MTDPATWPGDVRHAVLARADEVAEEVRRAGGDERLAQLAAVRVIQAETATLAWERDDVTGRDDDGWGLQR